MADGFQRLTDQVVEYVRSMMDDLREDPVGDSPIEQLLFAALVAMTNVSASEYRIVHHAIDHADLQRALARESPIHLIVVPQAQLEGWRVDFLIYAWDFGRVTGRQQWRRLIVECDGHEFHERTRAQAARDRSRDREFQIRGYTVLRFTGSQIHADPLGCAQEISAWGTMGW